MLLRLWQRLPHDSASRVMGMASSASMAAQKGQRDGDGAACAKPAASKNVQLLALQHARDTGALSAALFAQAKAALGQQ